MKIKVVIIQKFVTYHIIWLIHEDKTPTKISIVLDASSSELYFPSLNDCLSPSPNLTPDILKFALQLNLINVTITADIEGTFLLIALT